MSTNGGAIIGTLPEFVYKCARIDRIAAIFDAEKVTYTFEKVKNEMDALAAGLLSTGLRSQDRVLICGSNTAHFFISSLACARADLIFSLMSPNFASADQLKYALNKGGFRAIICFPASRETEFLNNLLNDIAPELMHSAKGHLCSKAIPKLTHVIMAEEEHKHAGTFTLSEIYGRSNRERVDKLPDFMNWDTHKLAALQFTSGISAAPKLIGLTHYQLLNGCQAAARAIGFNESSSVCCALPLFKIPVYTLTALAPFVTRTRVIFPSPSPLPKFLFESVQKYHFYSLVTALEHRCTHLVSNAVALGLILRVARTQNVHLPSIENVILLGERVPPEVTRNITSQFENAQKVMQSFLSLINTLNITWSSPRCRCILYARNPNALEDFSELIPNMSPLKNGFMLTEVASIPILTWDTMKSNDIGKSLDEFKVEVRELNIRTNWNVNGKLGELYIKPIEGSKFLGYESPYEPVDEWIGTGDVVVQDNSGAIELIANKEDLIMNNSGEIIEHWHLEKAICSQKEVKGAQIVALGKKLPLYAFVVLKNPKSNVDMILTDLISLCKNNGFVVPAKFAFVDDFPRMNTKIQKYRMRQMLERGEVQLKP